jgi:AAA15 family ATPase/GTPase
MLIRFVVENVFSFGDRKEFNMIPRPRLNTLSHHKYKICGIDLLKMTSVYGANAAGKSNLVKAIELLQNIVVEEKLPLNIKNLQFKFQDLSNSNPMLLAIEFINDDIPFLYAIEILGDRIATEELYISGLGKTDKLLFERKTNSENETTLKFGSELEKNPEIKPFRDVLIKSFVRYNKPIFKLMSENGENYFPEVKNAFNWLKVKLEIVTPSSHPSIFAHKIDITPDLKRYAEETLFSLKIGIKKLLNLKLPFIEAFGEDLNSEMREICQKIEEDPQRIIGLRTRQGNEIVVLKENNEIVVKQLQLEHEGKDKISVQFYLDEESDGTLRLLDLVPAFRDISQNHKVYFIDEIERSIHPLLIKELVSKFSNDEQTNGQLIFTTHESNLLDQEIFRQDEIWFAEKDETGSTDLYSLSDFKEHKTIDIRKGYLNGRYGSIPFLANLKDINWHNHAVE